MLGRGHHIGQVGIVALHAGDKGDAHMRGQERVLAIGLLAPAPARIAIDVDVRRPCIQPGADFAQMARFAAQRVERAHLDADRAGHVMDERRVERGGKAYGLGEIGGGHRADRAMQAFRPPVIGRDIQARDRGGDIDKLRHLFLGGQLAHQIGGHLVGLRHRARALGQRRLRQRQQQGGGKSGARNGHARGIQKMGHTILP